jgi:tripartite ATP-independent transporter DctM subunit
MHDPLLILIGSFSLLLILIFLGVQIGIAMALIGVLGFIVFGSGIGLVSLIPFGALDSFILIAIPLFILMGEILLHCGASEMIYRGASKLFSWVPGGLLHSNIASCAMFAAISGSSPATAATIGTVAIPALKKRGYGIEIVLGSLAAGGTLGILIPPSINMIVYGMLAQASVGALFAGGVIPGIILSVLFMTYIAIMAFKKPSLAPTETPFSIKAALFSFKDFWPLFVLAIIIFGGIFGGIVTPTEAAAIGVGASLIMAMALGRLNFDALYRSLISSAEITCMVLIVLVGAHIFGAFLSRAAVPIYIAELVADADLSKIQFLLVLYFVYLVLGLFMEQLSVLVLTLPIVLPILKDFGVDIIWFGVIVTILAELGMLTPPYGINLFVIQGVSKEDLTKVIKGSTPFFLIMFFGILLFTLFPSLILWLPSIVLR